MRPVPKIADPHLVCLSRAAGSVRLIPQSHLWNPFPEGEGHTASSEAVWFQVPSHPKCLSFSGSQSRCLYPPPARGRVWACVLRACPFSHSARSKGSRSLRAMSEIRYWLGRLDSVRKYRYGNWTQFPPRNCPKERQRLAFGLVVKAQTFKAGGPGFNSEPRFFRRPFFPG